MITRSNYFMQFDKLDEGEKRINIVLDLREVISVEYSVESGIILLRSGHHYRVRPGVAQAMADNLKLLGLIEVETDLGDQVPDNITSIGLSS
jgi:hypothetical protein